MENDTPVIEIKDLSRRYGKTDAVNGLSLTVQPGKCYGFFGRNDDQVPAEFAPAHDGFGPRVWPGPRQG